MTKKVVYGFHKLSKKDRNEIEEEMRDNYKKYVSPLLPYSLSPYRGKGKYFDKVQGMGQYKKDGE